MKFLIITLCVVGCVAGSGISWPGAVPVTSLGAVPVTSPVVRTVASPLVRTLLPAQKGFAYSTSQYINAVPSLAYSVGYRPQLAYHFNGYNSFPISPYFPQYFPSSYPSSFFYPQLSPVGQAPISSISPISPISPIAPFPGQRPETSTPSAPTQQPAGDSDTEVIDSAKAPEQPQPSPAPTPAQPQPPQFPPASTFPNFPSSPSFPQMEPQFPQFPQFPQADGSQPQFPQFPQADGSQPQFPQLPQFPQFPQLPGFPQLPANLFPQSPSTPPPATFPGASSDDKGINDEDTISVESA